MMQIERSRLFTIAGALLCALLPVGGPYARASDGFSLRLGHQAEVTAVAMSGDGELIASADDGGNVIVWNARTGEQRSHLRHGSSEISWIGFSPDGAWLAASTEETVTIWELENERVMRQLAPERSLGGAARIQALSFAADGHLLGLVDDSVLAWDPEGDGTQIVAEQLEGYKGSFSRDGSRLATIDMGGGIRVYDLHGDRSEVRFRLPDDELVSSFDLSPRGTAVLVRTIGGPARVFEAGDGSERLRIEPDGFATVRDARFSNDESMLVTLGPGSALVVRDPATGRQRTRIALEDLDPKVLALTSGGGRAVVGDEEGYVAVVDLERGVEAVRLGRRAVRPMALSVSPDGRWLAFAPWLHRHVQVWDLRSGRPRRLEAPKPRSGSLWDLAFSDDGARLVGSFGDAVVEWDVETGRELRRVVVPDAAYGKAQVSVDGRWLAATEAEEFEDVLLVAAATGEVAHRLEGPESGPEVLRFVPGGGLLLAGGGASSVVAWEVEGGEERFRVSHGDQIQSVDGLVLSTDGSFAVTIAGWDARVWSTQDGAERARIAEAGLLVSVAVSPDDRLVALGNRQGEITVVDLLSGRVQRRLVGHASAVREVAFGPDGRWLASAGWNGELRFWSLASGDVLARIFHMEDGDWIGVAGDRFDASDLGTATALLVPEGRVVHESELAARRTPAFLTTALERAEALPVAPIAEAAESEAQRAVTLVPQYGHGDDVSAVAWSPDGRLLATGGEDQLVHLWDVSSGLRLRGFRGHRDAVQALLFLPDGRLVSGGADSSVRQWDAATGATLWESVVGGRLGAGVVGLARHGGQIVVAMLGRVAFLDAQTGRVERRVDLAALDLETGIIVDLAASDEGVWALATGAGGAPVLVRVDGEPRHTVLPLATGTPWALALSPGGRLVASSTDAMDVEVFDRVTEEILVLSPLMSLQSVLAFSPDESQLAVAGDGLQIFELVRGTQAFEGDPDDTVGALAFSPDGTRISAGADERVALFELERAGEPRFLTGRMVALDFVEFSSDGRRLLTSAGEIWDLDLGQPRQRFARPGSGVVDATTSADGRFLAALSERRGTIRVWNLETGRRVHRVRTSRESVHFGAVGMAPDGSRVYAVTPTGFWAIEVGSDAEPRKQAFDADEFSGFDVSGATGRGILASDKRTAVVVDLETGEELLRWSDISSYVSAVALSPDGQTAAIGGYGITLLDVDSGESVGNVGSVQASVDALAFSGDGSRLALASDDQRVEIWHLESEAQIGSLGGHDGAVETLAFHPTAPVLASSGEDGLVRFWHLETEREFVTAASFEDGSWVVADPEGRFDATNLESVQGMVWVRAREPMRPLPVEIFLRDYYAPNLLARALGGERMEPVQAIEDLNVEQPRARVVVIDTGAGGRATVVVEVEGGAGICTRAGTEQANGAFDLRLFRNGVLVRQREGRTPLDGEGRGRVVFEDVLLPTRSEYDQVAFSTYAFNCDGVKSGTELEVADLPAVEPRPRRVFLVAFGANRFASPHLELRFAAHDARAVVRALEARLQAGDSGVDHVISATLVSDDELVEGELPATREHLEAVFERLRGSVDPQQAATPDDVLIVSLSTHGFRDPSGGFHLLSEEAEGPGSPPGSSISSADLRDWLRTVDAGHMVLIVDACHSASGVEAGGFKPGPFGSRGLGQLAWDKRMRVLAASQADAVALESTSLSHGLLTYALLVDGLEGGDADRDEDGSIGVGEWLQFGADRVPELADAIERGEIRGGWSIGYGDDELTSLPRAQILQQPVLFDFAIEADRIDLAPQ